MANVVPDLEHLKRENSIPAEIKRTVVEIKPLSPEQEAKVQAERRALRVREAIRSQDPAAKVTVNASLHKVKTPGGVAAYHAERQRTALELAKELKGKERSFALNLAKEHGAAKRDARKRVPKGNPNGGQYTR